MSETHLLIDAKNMLYRAIFVAKSDVAFKQTGHHVINIVLHFICHLYRLFEPTQIHIFWDTERETIWRRDLIPSYKNQRQDDEHINKVENDLLDLIKISIDLFKVIGVKQYYRIRMEADDLIYAFCRLNKKSAIVIVSSDGDLKQISYDYPNVSIHNPLSKKELEPVPKIDPVLYKVFCGDKSDNIDGYYGIGDVKSRVLCEDLNKRMEFLESKKAIIKRKGEKVWVGDAKFRENMRMIDLSLCPYLVDNMLYIAKNQIKPAKFNLKEIRKIISKYKLRGVTADIPRYITPLKKLSETKNGSID